MLPSVHNRDLGTTKTLQGSVRVNLFPCTDFTLCNCIHRFLFNFIFNLCVYYFIVLLFTFLSFCLFILFFYSLLNSYLIFYYLLLFIYYF